MSLLDCPLQIRCFLNCCFLTAFSAVWLFHYWKESMLHILIYSSSHHFQQRQESGCLLKVKSCLCESNFFMPLTTECKKKTLPRAFTHDSIFCCIFVFFVLFRLCLQRFVFSYKWVFFYWIAGRAELKYCVTAPHWSNCVIGGPYIRSYGIKQIFFNKNICPFFFFTLFQIPHIVAKHN